MKKSEKNFIEQLNEKISPKKDFSSIKNEIDFSKYTKCAKKRENLFTKKRLLFGTMFSFCVITLSIVLPFAINNSNDDTSTNIPPTVNSKANMDIKNKNDLIIEYEKNAHFVTDSVKLETKEINGKSYLIDSSKYTVDAKEFKYGEVGNYSINVFLNESPSKNIQYDVEVIDDEIYNISLGEYRKVYYVGEQPIVQDVVINKTRTSGDIKVAKITEYSIDLSSFNSGEIGTYTIGITLKTNDLFHLEYEVEVKPLIEAELDGRYAFIDNYLQVGQPTIWAFDIEDSIITPNYQDVDVLMKGELKFSEKNGELILSCDKTTQTARYIPSTRTLLVSGIAGDPDIPCFKINRTDYFIKLKSDEIGFSSTTTYIAEDGFLSNGTISYLKFFYGGCYLDNEMNETITSSTEFFSDSYIYVGTKPIEDTKTYFGRWYDFNQEVVLNFTEEGVSICSGYFTKYTIQEYENGIFWIRVGMEVFIYDSNEDIIGLTEIVNGTIWKKLYRYDEEIQVIVTIYFSYSSQKSERVVKKGEKLKTVFISDSGTINWWSINPDYTFNENKTFSNVDSYSKGLSDYNGVYGDYKDNYTITGAWTVGRLGQGHNYYFVQYENYEISRIGYIEVVDFDISTTDIITRIHFDDETVEDLILKKYDSIEFNGIIYNKNSKLFKNLSFVGTYHNEEETDKIIITEEGSLGRTFVDSTGYIYHSYYGLYIANMSDNEVNLYYYEQDVYNNRIEHTLTLFKIDDNWSFVIDNATYHQTSNVVETL